MVECEDSGAPVGSISGAGLEEAEDGRFVGSEGVGGSALCWRATAGGEVEERETGVEVSGVGWGIVIPVPPIALAVAGSGEVTGIRRPSMVV